MHGLDGIVRARFAGDVVECDDLAHIRHDDGRHIQRIHLIRLYGCAFRCEILLDKIDDILEDGFPLVLLCSVLLRGIGDDGFEFLEESFHVDSEIRRQDRKYLRFGELVFVSSSCGSYRLIREAGEDAFKHGLLFVGEFHIIALVVILDGDDIGFGIGLIYQSVPEPYHQRPEGSHIAGARILYRIDERIDGIIDKLHLRSEVCLEIEEGDFEILGDLCRIRLGIIDPSYDGFIFRFVFLEIEFVAEEILIVILRGIAVAVERNIRIDIACSFGIIVPDIEQYAVAEILSDIEIDISAAGDGHLRDREDMQVSCVLVAGGHRKRPPLVGHIRIFIGHLHGDEIFSVIRIREGERISGRHDVSGILLAFGHIEADGLVGDLSEAHIPEDSELIERIGKEHRLEPALDDDISSDADAFVSPIEDGCSRPVSEFVRFGIDMRDAIGFGREIPGAVAVEIVLDSPLPHEVGPIGDDLGDDIELHFIAYLRTSDSGF